MAGRSLKTALLVAVSFCALGLAAAPAGAYVIDQRCEWDGGDPDYWLPILTDMPIGWDAQSFVPSVAENVGVELFMSWTSTGLRTATVTLRLREDTISGGIVAESVAEVTVPPPSLPREDSSIWATFLFPQSVVLDVGRTYVIEAIGDPVRTIAWNVIGWNDLPYDYYAAGGEITSEGVVSATSDLCFRTLVVPEPATLGLLAFGAGLILRKRTRS